MSIYIENGTDSISELAQHIVENHGAELLDVTMSPRKEHANIKLTVDAEGGISIDTCAQISRAMINLLHEKDLFSAGFKIEVSSPGVDKPLIDEDDFRRKKGLSVRVWHKDPQHKSPFEGIIRKVEKGYITFELENDTVGMELNKIKNGKIVVSI